MPGRPADAAPAASTSSRVKALKLQRTCSRHSRPPPVARACTAAGTAAAPRSAAPGRAASAAAGRAVSRRRDMDTSLRCGTGGGAVAEGRTGLLWALSPAPSVPVRRLGAAAAELLARGAPVGLAVGLTGPTGPAGSNAAAPMLSPGCRIMVTPCSCALALRVCRCLYGATMGSKRSLSAPETSRVDSGTYTGQSCFGNGG